ncbi:hypothetical protein [Nocardia aurantia]|uniref:Uncharacterized protein n=1 Tax=Nocardia aurantia TaxID=2585199 RepID=A0A7K0DKQ4_9NOCA|nr:hypothetical protein [Nocardia aurantia]MQY26363.1 hypothetical protein [Nocardia aurantia]
MFGKFERNKDLIQELTSSGARRIGNIATIITGTVAEVTREIGEWVTDAIEMREAAAAAEADRRAAAPVNQGRSEPDVLLEDPAPEIRPTAAQPFIDAEKRIVDPGEH